MPTMRQTVQASLDIESIDASDRKIAQELLDIIDDEDLEAILSLVNNENFGWKFIVDNVRKKIELTKKGALTQDWNALFLSEATALNELLARK